jgi:hypothetical protein
MFRINVDTSKKGKNHKKRSPGVSPGVKNPRLFQPDKPWSRGYRKEELSGHPLLYPVY